MPTPARGNTPFKTDPTPRYPHIVLALDIISVSPPLLHWIIFIPNPGQSDAEVQHGTKVHVKAYPNSTSRFFPTDFWGFEAEPFTLATSMSIAAAAVIGKLKDKTIKQLIEFLELIPLEVPAADRQREPVFTCHVWMREVLRRMHDARYIHCPDVDALEAEMWDYGRPAIQARQNNTFRMAKLVTAKNSCTL